MADVPGLGADQPQAAEMRSRPFFSSRLGFLRRSCNGLHTHLTVAEPPHFIACPQNLTMSEQNTLMYPSPIASVSHWTPAGRNWETDPFFDRAYI
jgi:hypothetical protein